MSGGIGAFVTTAARHQVRRLVDSAIDGIDLALRSLVGDDLGQRLARADEERRATGPTGPNFYLGVPVPGADETFRPPQPPGAAEERRGPIHPDRLTGPRPTLPDRREVDRRLYGKSSPGAAKAVRSEHAAGVAGEGVSAVEQEPGGGAGTPTAVAQAVAEHLVGSGAYGPHEAGGIGRRAAEAVLRHFNVTPK